MSDPRIPQAPYPLERMGAKFPPHEVGSHGPFRRLLHLMTAFDSRVLGLPYSKACRVDMTCPDARLLSALTIFFVPDPLQDAPPAGFYATTLHLTACLNGGAGFSEVEDLIGTAAAPAVLVSPGLWGFLYSPTEEVEALRADLVLGPTDNLYCEGKWFAEARWQAKEPMTEIEWRDAIALCNLVGDSPGKIHYGPPG